MRGPVMVRRWPMGVLGGLLLGATLAFEMPRNGLAAERSAGGAGVAKTFIERVGCDRGLCLVVGNEGRIALDAARSSPFLVHFITPEQAVARQAQQAADTAGLGIRRLAIETRPLDRLPEADHLADVVILDATVPADQRGGLIAEALRVARPQGVVFVAADRQGAAATSALEAVAKKAGAKSTKTFEAGGRIWFEIRKPALAGAGQWSHWEHGPDNNPVAEDTIIKFPHLTQFLAEPLYIGMPSITTAAGGRTFLAIGHIAHHPREWDTLQWLIARNGYNGAILWKRKLPDGYLVHRSAFVATPDTFFMIDGESCLKLNPQTGAEQGRIRIPGVDGQWKWMVLTDGVLYVMAGPPDPPAQLMRGDRTFGGWSWADMSRGYYSRPHVPWGFGNVLAAYELATGKTLWIHKVTEGLIDSRALAVGEDKLFLYCPGHFLRCLDRRTGKVAWTNEDKRTIELIEQPGRGLTSTPGFRTACMAVYTPHAIVIQGQTRMNVVAISPDDGYLLWSKKKVTNNPNAIYVDGHLVLGIGPGGSHVMLDPISGEVLENLRFHKRACTRLTACSDSLFVRGEGLLRYDRQKKKVLIDGAARPGCNDGAIAANGLLYIGPWQCDCNLQLIGALGKCSAGDFRIDRAANADKRERLEPGDGGIEPTQPLEVTDRDWPTYRGDRDRSASTPVSLPGGRFRVQWQFAPTRAFTPTVPTAAGGLVFFGGEDGRVRALDAATGQLRWQFATFSPIKMPPTIWDGRAFFGSGDGYVYCLEAATGRLLWRFRAAPVDRLIPVYGSLSSTWPVNTGVLIDDGTAYFAAGIIDSDGTSVYAIDARTGQIKWQNHSSGYLNPELRKGVSAQGNLTILGDRLLMAGGNQVSPAPFSLETGECLAGPIRQGEPKANDGRFVGALWGEYAIQGGRILYSAPENVATKGYFDIHTKGRRVTLNYGGVPPAWNDTTLALVNFKHGKLTCCDVAKVKEAIVNWQPPRGPRAARQRLGLAQALRRLQAVRWETDMGESYKFEVVSLAVCPNAVVATFKQQLRFRAHPQWFVAAFHVESGQPLTRMELPGEPLPDGLLIDRDGRVVVTLLDGRVLAYGR
ncbi:MAG: PQQ-binding-like beta-propeller repeat protein [Planctomycetes bacterium]|nr:PQQ-binding-like beta-propeller repeat protein [Planctomycetota bacterium]